MKRKKKKYNKSKKRVVATLLNSKYISRYERASPFLHHLKVKSEIWDLEVKLGRFWDHFGTLVPFGTKSQIWDLIIAPASRTPFRLVPPSCLPLQAPRWAPLQAPFSLAAFTATSRFFFELEFVPRYVRRIKLQLVLGETGKVETKRRNKIGGKIPTLPSHLPVHQPSLPEIFSSLLRTSITPPFTNPSSSSP